MLTSRGCGSLCLSIPLLTRKENVVFVDRGNKGSCHGRKMENGIHLGGNKGERESESGTAEEANLLCGSCW